MAREPELPPGYRLEAEDSVPSTNGVALAAARRGDPGHLWVTAGEQTDGRGRRGRPWSTGRGNLAASLLLVDPALPEAAATVSFVAGVALHQAVVDVAGPAVAERLALKWPNDLLLDRLKVAGILVEGEMLTDGRFAVVIGVGVNCLTHPEIDGPLQSTDLASRGVPVDSSTLFGRLALRMAGEIVHWHRGAGFATIRRAWLARATGVGETVRVTLPQRTVDGLFEAFDDAGRLIVARADGGREIVSAGDVFFGGGSRADGAGA